MLHILSVKNFMLQARRMLPNSENCLGLPVWMAAWEPGMHMSIKKKIVRCLRSATCDKEAFNRRLLKWCKCFREVEKELNRCRKC